MMEDRIDNLIYEIRDVQVMLDSDLAVLFDVETKVFNQAVKRNINRFPASFRFQLTKDEFSTLRSQIVTLNKNSLSNHHEVESVNILRSRSVTSSEHGGRRHLPYVFTEQGVAMLTGVIRSDIAIEMSIKIMTAFVEMRKIISSNRLLIHRLDSIEYRQLIYQKESDEKFNQLFNAFQDEKKNEKEGIFFAGQIYDAYSFVIQLIEKAEKEILLIDNYLDNSVLDMLSKKNDKVNISIFTNKKSKLKAVDIQKFNQQYPLLEIKYSDAIHDRFLLVDNMNLYHFGASLKDLGKKCFAFSILEDKALITNLLKTL